MGDGELRGATIIIPEAVSLSSKLRHPNNVNALIALGLFSIFLES